MNSLFISIKDKLMNKISIFFFLMLTIFNICYALPYTKDNFQTYMKESIKLTNLEIKESKERFESEKALFEQEKQLGRISEEVEINAKNYFMYKNWDIQMLYKMLDCYENNLVDEFSKILDEINIVRNIMYVNYFSNVEDNDDFFEEKEASYYIEKYGVEYSIRYMNAYALLNQTYGNDYRHAKYLESKKVCREYINMKNEGVTSKDIYNLDAWDYLKSILLESSLHSFFIPILCFIYISVIFKELFQTKQIYLIFVQPSKVKKLFKEFFIVFFCFLLLVLGSIIFPTIFLTLVRGFYFENIGIFVDYQGLFHKMALNFDKDIIYRMFSQTLYLTNVEGLFVINNRIEILPLFIGLFLLTLISILKLLSYALLGWLGIQLFKGRRVIIYFFVIIIVYVISQNTNVLDTIWNPFSYVSSLRIMQGYGSLTYFSACIIFVLVNIILCICNFKLINRKEW